MLSGSGGGLDAASLCLAPGRRMLLVDAAYVGPSADALVVANDAIATHFVTIAGRMEVRGWDADSQTFEMITSYRRGWMDDPVPVEGSSLHRIDPLGPDEASNWALGAISPGL